jgi:hypothetical protein
MARCTLTVSASYRWFVIEYWWFGCTVGLPIVAAAAFQAAAPAFTALRRGRKGRLKAGCGQDCPPPKKKLAPA